jgi:hypothetical protein
MAHGRTDDPSRPDDGVAVESDRASGAPSETGEGPSLDLREREPLIDLRGAPSVRFAAPLAHGMPVASAHLTPEIVAFERRDAFQRSRLVAVVVIAVLNAFDLVTTYLAISRGAHEANPIVAWMISSRFIVFAKVMLCGSLILGAVAATHRRRRVTLAGLCAAWAVVGVYSLVVVINTSTLWAHLR